MTVYLVQIEDEFGESSAIHGVYISEDKANGEAQRLESSLHGMIVYVTSHEVEE